jgi:hypothetical protein
VNERDELGRDLAPDYMTAVRDVSGGTLLAPFATGMFRQARRELP